jgi:hypothetical protein
LCGWEKRSGVVEGRRGGVWLVDGNKVNKVKMIVKKVVNKDCNIRELNIIYVAIELGKMSFQHGNHNT